MRVAGGRRRRGAVYSSLTAWRHKAECLGAHNEPTTTSERRCAVWGANLGLHTHSQALSPGNTLVLLCPARTCPQHAQARALGPAPLPTCLRQPALQHAGRLVRRALHHMLLPLAHQQLVGVHQLAREEGHPAKGHLHTAECVLSWWVGRLTGEVAEGTNISRAGQVWFCSVIPGQCRTAAVYCLVHTLASHACTAGPPMRTQHSPSPAAESARAGWPPGLRCPAAPGALPEAPGTGCAWRPPPAGGTHACY